MLRSLLRRLVPQRQRTLLRASLRCLSDSLVQRRFARRAGQPSGWPTVLQISQQIMPSEYLRQKVHNLRLAAGMLERTVVNEGEYFSFWRLVGPADAAHGFLISRSIMAGRVAEAEGGGLCQLSGLLYEAALRTGCEIIERHHHSVDIYRESERFTPLGLDAAVVFPNKDLRFRNTTGMPFEISLHVTDSELQIKLLAQEKPDMCEIEIYRSDDHSSNTRTTELIQRQGRRLTSITSKYKIFGAGQ